MEVVAFSSSSPLCSPCCKCTLFPLLKALQWWVEHSQQWHALHMPAESAALADAASDAASEMPSGQFACAVLLQDACFAWAAQANATEGSQADEAKQPASAPACGWALSHSRDVLRELSLAIPQGGLTAIVGDIGSGDHAHATLPISELL